MNESILAARSFGTVRVGELKLVPVDIEWLATARRVGELKSDSREGKNVYTGCVDHLRPGGANTLRVIGQEAVARSKRAPVQIKVKRWRLKTVLQNIVYCAVRVVRHVRGIRLHFGKTCLWFDLIEELLWEAEMSRYVFI